MQVGKRTELLHHLAQLLVEGDLWEKKNAALCFGNLCCDWSAASHLYGFPQSSAACCFVSLPASSQEPRL